MITDVNLNFKDEILNIYSDRFVAKELKLSPLHNPNGYMNCKHQFEEVVSVRIDNQDTFNCIDEPSKYSIPVNSVDGQYIGVDLPLDMALPWKDIENQLLYVFVTTESYKYYFASKTLNYSCWHKVEQITDGGKKGYLISRDPNQNNNWVPWIKVLYNASSRMYEYYENYNYPPNEFYTPITGLNREIVITYFDEGSTVLNTIKQYYGDTMVSMPGAPYPVYYYWPGDSTGLEFLNLPNAEIKSFEYEPTSSNPGLFKEVTTTLYKYVFFNKTALNRYLWNNVKHLLKRDCCGHLETINEDYLLMKDGFYNSIANNSYKEANEFWKLMHNQKNVIMSNCGCGK